MHKILLDAKVWLIYFHKAITLLDTTLFQTQASIYVQNNE